MRHFTESSLFAKVPFFGVSGLQRVKTLVYFLDTSVMIVSTKDKGAYYITYEIKWINFLPILFRYKTVRS